MGTRQISGNICFKFLVQGREYFFAVVLLSPYKAALSVSNVRMLKIVHKKKKDRERDKERAVIAKVVRGLNPIRRQPRRSGPLPLYYTLRYTMWRFTLHF
jgi:hypothetical protein